MRSDHRLLSNALRAGVPALRNVLFCLWSLCFSTFAAAQAAVTEVSPPTQPYVELFSPCRASPSEELVARQYYEALRDRKRFNEFARQSNELRQRPIDSLSAIDAEVFFLLLRQMVFHRLLDGQEAAQGRDEIILNGRDYGRRLLERFGKDSFVYCAWLESETLIHSKFSDRFIARERDLARSTYIAFLEAALNGKVQTDTFPDQLHFTAGQLYLDRGFEVLPDEKRAGPLFEAGARHLLAAASDTRDERYISNWQRYAFMLNELALSQQLEIANRLLVHVEKVASAKPALSDSELSTYLHLLNVAGDASLNAKNGNIAVSVFGRHLRVVQELRRRHPLDPTYEVDEALGFVSLGDARVLTGEVSAAAQAYRNALRVFRSSSTSAQDMLKFQDFPEELRSRRKGIEPLIPR